MLRPILITRMDKLPVSVLVPVKNEISNIRECLRGLDFADEIVVVDSASTRDKYRRITSTMCGEGWGEVTSAM